MHHSHHAWIYIQTCGGDPSYKVLMDIGIIPPEVGTAPPRRAHASTLKADQRFSARAQVCSWTAQNFNAKRSHASPPHALTWKILLHVAGRHKRLHAFKFWHSGCCRHSSRTNTRAGARLHPQHADHGKPSARCLSWLSAPPLRSMP